MDINFASQSVARGLHVALIMDGNGRWAVARGLPRTVGHRAGAAALSRVVHAAPSVGISTLTAFAFSSDNWARSPEEVDALMTLFARHLATERASSVAAGVRVSMIGRRDRLPVSLRTEIDATERATARGGRLHLRLAIDYSSRDSIVRAARSASERNDWTTAGFEERLAEAMGTTWVPPVDLLIRSGAELRLSDFLLWECAYAELVFLTTPWPDVGSDHLAAAIREYRTRERRFGGVSDAPRPRPAA